LVAIVTKALKRKEVELGFIHIPSKNRGELLGSTAPLETKLNDLPAKVDKFGRLWSNYLKQRYPIGTQVVIIKNNNGFQIAAMELKKESAVLEITKPIETVTASASVELPKKDIPHEALEKCSTESTVETPNILSPDEKICIGKVKPCFQAKSAWIFTRWPSIKQNIASILC
jgi:hypothetical protein